MKIGEISNGTSLFLLVVLFGCTFCLSKIEKKDSIKPTIAMGNVSQLFQDGKDIISSLSRGE